jgi:hypothetical protein
LVRPPQRRCESYGRQWHSQNHSASLKALTALALYFPHWVLGGSHKARGSSLSFEALGTRCECHPRFGHVRQHLFTEHVELDPLGARLVHNQLAQLLPPFLILLSIAEWLTRFELRPSGSAYAVDNLQV